MKPNQLILFILFLVLFACGDSGNKIVIRGEITGEIPEKVEYTDPVRGVCNWGFAKSVVPDSLGKFEIELEPATKGAIFIKLRTSYSQQGTLIVEPGKTYDIRFDLTNSESVFSVSDNSSMLQEAYNKLPNPEHIQVGAGEFFSDTSANHVKTTVEQRRTEEIAVFEKFLSEKTISQNVFDLVKTDRDCYYDAVLATVGWIKDYMSMLGMGGPFTQEFADLWKETFENPLFTNPDIVKSPWFTFYAEGYIYFQEYINGNFTKEKLDELKELQQPKTYRVNRASEYLPSELCEDYIASYLYDESIQQKYEKELIGLFDDFKSKYPKSAYISYISPLIEKVAEFHKTAESEFSSETKFVENYQTLNSLSEVVGTLPQGKIYVDVWATWCGPCKEEFSHKEELKALLQKKGIQMLYISLDRDQDSVQWKNMIKFYNLEGNHVRANKEMDADLREIFDRSGSISIPWYILIDSDGKILNKHASPPSQIGDLEKEID